MFRTRCSRMRDTNSQRHPAQRTALVCGVSMPMSQTCLQSGKTSNSNQENPDRQFAHHERPDRAQLEYLLAARQVLIAWQAPAKRRYTTLTAATCRGEFLKHLQCAAFALRKRMRQPEFLSKGNICPYELTSHRQTVVRRSIASDFFYRFANHNCDGEPTALREAA